jgi:hypothetical protein
MSVREAINQKPAIAYSVGGLLLAVAAVVGVMNLAGGGASAKPGDQVYGTVDGQAYFPVAASEIPPFDHQGKQAYRAMVYACDGQAKVFYLLSYTPEGKAAAEAQLKQGADGPTPEQTLVRKPGDANWTPMNDPKVGQITDTRCSNGRPASPVLPGR